MKNRRLKTWPVIILLVCIILIICIVSIINSLKSKKINKNEVIDTILKYDYNLQENKSNYYKSLFKKLKSILSEKNINEEEYASTVSQLFLTDLFSLDYAINKNDIGGTEYIYEDYKDTFITKVKDTLYQNIESNIYGNRNQELPIVTKVNVTNIESKIYDSDVISDNKSYYIDCIVEYKKDLNYPKEVSLILVHNKNKLEIVSMK